MGISDILVKPRHFSWTMALYAKTIIYDICNLTLFKVKAGYRLKRALGIVLATILISYLSVEIIVNIDIDIL